jgi:MFS family permease
VLGAVLNALLLLPFILLFTPAGFLSDRHAKPRVLRAAAAAALVLALLSTLFYHLGWFWPALVAVALALALAVAMAAAMAGPLASSRPTSVRVRLYSGCSHKLPRGWDLMHCSAWASMY